MDRGIVYPSSIPLDTDNLYPQRAAMEAIGWLMQALWGSPNNAFVFGLGCTPSGMNAVVGPGGIVVTTVVDANQYGSLPANTNALVKMGINQTSTTFPITAPTTTGDSINYLIQGLFLEQDGSALVLPYYNAANPSVTYAGPQNDGISQNTRRMQTVSLESLAGTPAPTGSQTTPTPTAGWTPLWVVTVAEGQSSLTASDISPYPGAPFASPSSPILTLSLGASPATYTAVVPGNLMLSGGTVTGITLTRGGGSATLSTSVATIPMSLGDSVTITASTMPTVYFVPG